MKRWSFRIQLDRDGFIEFHAKFLFPEIVAEKMPTVYYRQTLGACPTIKDNTDSVNEVAEFQYLSPIAYSASDLLSVFRAYFVISPRAIRKS